MAVQPFLSDDIGYADLLGTLNWTSAGIYLALITTTQSITRGAQTWGDIKNNADATRIALSTLTPAVAVHDTAVRLTHTKAQFTESGSKTGRYVFYLIGDSASPADADKVIGYVDLTGDGNASSTDAEFSFTPHATAGLVKIARSAAA
jgi:hypothetical protein